MVTIQVCVGSACHLKGSYDVINKLTETIDKKSLNNRITVKAAFCLGECTNAVSVKVDDKRIYSLSQDKVEDFLDDILEGRHSD